MFRLLLNKCVTNMFKGICCVEAHTWKYLVANNSLSQAWQHNAMNYKAIAIAIHTKTKTKVWYIIYYNNKLLSNNINFTSLHYLAKYYNYGANTAK